MKLATHIVPPAFLVLMTGVSRCIKTAHETILVYTDGSKETVNTDTLPPDLDWQDWFAVVGAIQELRKDKA